jgi:hypothetical protein
MTKEEIIYLAVGVLIGWLAWSEFGSCNCHHRRRGAPSETVTANNRNYPESEFPPHCNGGCL